MENSLNLKDFQIAGKSLALAKRSEVDALESELWITFPKGYREYVTQLGQGSLSSFVRVYPPWQIAKELTEWRRRIEKHWFWDAGRKLLPKPRAIECVIVGDTFSGDELVFHPCRPEALFVLSSESGRVFDAGPDLLTAVDWMCSSGKLTSRISELIFEPFDSRLESDDQDSGSEKVVDPPGESLDALIELAKRWAERHRIAKLARDDIKSAIEKNQKVEMLYSAISFRGHDPHGPGCIAQFRVTDKASGLDLGTLYWNKDDVSHGFEIEWNETTVDKARRSRRGR